MANASVGEALIILTNEADQPEKAFQELFRDCGVDYGMLAALWNEEVGTGEILLFQFVQFLEQLHNLQKEQGFVQEWEQHVRLVVQGVVMVKEPSRLLVQIDSCSYDIAISARENANVFRKAREGQRI